MKWLKYRHSFSSHLGNWNWQLLNDDAEDEDIKELVRDHANEYSYSDKYHGVDFEVVPEAPDWVIEMKIHDAATILDAAQKAFETFRYLLGSAKPCRQCGAAEVETTEARRTAGHFDFKSCPTCGRRVRVITVPFWLMPGDDAALHLLGSLVEQGKRSVKSKKFRWPVESKEEEEAYSRLNRLGLVGGSAHGNVYEIYATTHGETEWARHKVRLEDTHDEWFVRVVTQWKRKDEEHTS